MLLIDSAAATEWCTLRGLAVRTDWMQRLSFPGGYPVGIRLQTPVAATARVALTEVLLTSDLLVESGARCGCLVWLQDWDIWSESVERVGRQLLAGLRGGSALNEEVRSAPAHALDADEFAAAQALIAIPLLFEWDAYWVPENARHLAWITHDGRVEVRFRTQEDFRQELSRFRELEFAVETFEV